MQEWSEWRRLSFLLLIFTKSLWYPPLLDPVTGDSRGVLKRTAVFSSPPSHYILRYMHPVRLLFVIKTDRVFSAGRLQTGSQLQPHSAGTLQSDAAHANQCAPHMLDCTPPQRSPVFNNGLLWKKDTVNRVFINA